MNQTAHLFADLLNRLSASLNDFSDPANDVPNPFSQPIENDKTRNDEQPPDQPRCPLPGIPHTHTQRIVGFDDGSGNLNLAACGNFNLNGQNTG